MICTQFQEKSPSFNTQMNRHSSISCWCMFQYLLYHYHVNQYCTFPTNIIRSYIALTHSFSLIKSMQSASMQLQWWTISENSHCIPHCCWQQFVFSNIFQLNWQKQSHSYHISISTDWYQFNKLWYLTVDLLHEQNLFGFVVTEPRTSATYFHFSLASCRFFFGLVIFFLRFI